MAMKPLLRPMSFTRPTPLGADSASTRAHSMGRTASATAVSKPKDLPTSGMSLSIVLGTHATAIE